MGNEAIEQTFLSIFESIDYIMHSSFYEDKLNIAKIKKIFKKWYSSYTQYKTLKEISIKELKYLDLEITNIFDRYIKDEPVKENYVERLSYDFSLLEKEWKKEVLGGK
jgi:hypothetical protein